MAARKCLCPECHLSFVIVEPLPARVKCPVCETVIAIPVPTGRPAPAVAAPVAKPAIRAAKAAPTRRHETSAPPVVQPDIGQPQAEPTTNRRPLVVVILAASIVVYLLGGGAVAVFLMKSVKKAPPSTAEATAKPEPAVDDERPTAEPEAPVQAAPAVAAAEPQPSAPSEQQVKNNHAIERGIEYLKRALRLLTSNNMAAAPYTRDGLTALMGWTLLECGVPADDPVIARTADFLRKRSSRVHDTYSLSLGVLFFDKLGERSDRELIQTFALRLVAGQESNGAWTYNCSTSLTPEEEKQLVTYLSKSYYGSGLKAADGENADDLPAKLRKLSIVRAEKAQKQRGFVQVDNSNTQFAVLALWVAQRQGLPLKPVLGLVDRYFRDMQNSDGSWGYAGRSQQWRASMTCAGLLGLAVGKSVSSEPKEGESAERARDPDIEKAFRFLSTTIGPDAAHRAPFGTGRLINADAHGDLYYLWSLERVAMIYDLQTIGGKDWYSWATNVILPAQQSDGSWADNFGAPVDTCFALLVLKRVNVVKDLTANIKRVVNIKGVEGGDDKQDR